MKVRLNPDDLEVMSFDTVSGGMDARGTVAAQSGEYSCYLLECGSWGCASRFFPYSMCDTNCTDARPCEPCTEDWSDCWYPSEQQTDCGLCPSVHVTNCLACPV